MEKNKPLNSDKIVNKGLVITPHESELLSKEQERFNLLLERMKKAELKSEAERLILDAKLDECIRSVYPVNQELNKIKFLIIEEMYRYFSANKMSAPKRNAFIAYISEMTDGIIYGVNGLEEKETERLMEILDLLVSEENKKKSKRALQEERDEAFEMMISQMEADLQERGFIVDLSDLKFGMSTEEINKIVDEKLKHYAEPNPSSQNKKEKKKSKKEIEKEQRQKEIDEIKGKDLSSIYKSLAKILHPDLEQDDEIKVKKGEWMKRLTVAYEKKDLKTLLEIELEWALGEKNRIQSLTNDKLRLYNEMLFEQVLKMESQVMALAMDNKYSMLSFFADGVFNVSRWRPAFSIKKIKDQIRNFEFALEVLERHDKKTKDLIDRILKDQMRSSY
ncbi:hypothetical protein BH11BAC2_BH11BAC2_04770 [soil metagenome]